jgi:hypothetical protein
MVRTQPANTATPNVVPAGVHATQSHTARGTQGPGPITVDLDCEVWGVEGSRASAAASPATLVATLATDSQPVVALRSVGVSGPGPHWVTLQAGGGGGPVGSAGQLRK